MLGFLGSLFGVLGIFSLGLLFVPLGLLCTFFSFLKREILLGIVSLSVNVVAIIVSPTIWVAVLALFAANSDKYSNRSDPTAAPPPQLTTPQAVRTPDPMPAPLPTVDPGPTFEAFKSSYKYSGPLNLPEGIEKDSDGVWRNFAGKMIDPPDVNFAGRYWIFSNSCGTGCSFFSLVNVESGKQLSALDMFSVGEVAPRTKEGFTYFTKLVRRAESDMLVAQYQVDASSGLECRERVFLFKDEKLQPITKTRTGCAEY